MTDNTSFYFPKFNNSQIGTYFENPLVLNFAVLLQNVIPYQ